MRKLLVLFLGIFILLPGFGQKSYKATINLINIKDDKVSVELFVPKISENKVFYQLPNLTPGSYALYDYTGYIDEFTAYSASGAKLPVKENKTGQFLIKKAHTLKKIVYTVNDTWDDSTTGIDYIFPPSGTQIEKDKVFLINHFGFLGYFLGYEEYSYSVTYHKPPHLYASTPLKIKRLNDTTDAISNTDYNELADNPVFYSNPDTLSFFVDKTNIKVTTYSPNNIITSQYLKPILNEVSNSIKNFFGEIPIPEYSFYFYFAGYQEVAITKNQTYGALEHKASSVYFLPEIMPGEFLRSTILGIATHEFLHITAPLNLHSNEIHNFNYTEPNLSSHLWLYEGVVEYLSLWLLCNESLITKNDFIGEFRHKMILSEKYTDFSFTEMSKNITESPYNEMYNSVYSKGALIAFLLDIKINQLTQGEKNLQQVVIDLYEKYKSKSFDDDKIIDEIIALVHPDLEKFFTDYVIGSKPLPITNYLDKIGWIHEKEKKETLLTFGNIDLSFSPEINSIVINESNPKQNIFHFEGGEVITSVNEIEVTIDNFEKLSKLILSPNSEETMYLEVEKNGKTFNMEASPILMPVFEQHLITIDYNKTDSQEKMFYWVFSRR